MNDTVRKQNMALNQSWKRLNEQYHLYSVSHGLSDPAMWTLYALVESDTPLTQNDIVSMWMYPKQTVNFTISGLVKKGYVYLEQLSGGRNHKAIYLTESGKKLCDEVIRPLIELEERSLLQLTETERQQIAFLCEKQSRIFESIIQETIKK